MDKLCQTSVVVRRRRHHAKDRRLPELHGTRQQRQGSWSMWLSEDDFFKIMPCGTACHSENCPGTSSAENSMARLQSVYCVMRFEHSPAPKLDITELPVSTMPPQYYMSNRQYSGIRD